MEKIKIEITVIKTDNGKIRIMFDDSYIVPIKDTMENIAIISAFESEFKK